MVVEDASLLRAVRVGPEDTDRFLNLRWEGFVSDPDGFRFVRDDDEALGSQAWKECLADGYVVAATRKGEWLGIGGLSAVAGRLLDHKGLIWGMYVTPGARGTGAADCVMSALIEHARGRFRQLQLTVMADNLRARRFYERHGFEVFGIERDSVRRKSGFGDEALMGRRVYLGERSSAEVNR